MAAMSPQDSRGALVTTVVILAIVAVGSLVFAINEYAGHRKSTQDLESMSRSMNQIASSSDQATIVQSLMEAKNDPVYVNEASITGASQALPLAVAQRDLLARLAGGTDQPAQAIARARQAVQSAIRSATTQPATISANDDLTHVVQALTARVVGLQEETKRLTNGLTESQGQTQQAVREREAMLASQQEKLAAVQKTADQAISELEKYRNDSSQRVDQLTVDTKQAQEASQKTASDMQGELTKMQEQLQVVRQENAILKNRLNPTRVDPALPMVRQADGMIYQLPDQNTVYINLGQGDQIVQGMTFEVFDKLKGVPKVAADSQDKLLEGKASIEVIRVLPSASECRVTRRTPGAALAAGDLIVNLIYDKNVKYNFVVYGSFDLNGDRVFSPADTDIIRRLITQWGAQVATPQDGKEFTAADITPAVDFLVIGAEPQVPNVVANDPVAQNEAEVKRQELKQYQQIVQRAAELSVPILNQNRFLHLIGFYNQAGR